MKNWLRVVPYISLCIISLVIFILSKFISDNQIQNILINVFSNSIFFFIAYFFYDIIKEIIRIKERQYLDEYIRNKISNDIFVALYNLKKIIHGYSLDTNTLKNIFAIVEYSTIEINNSVKNQCYIGFQIFKNTDEIRSLFTDALNDNLILKYSSHIESINILRIVNNLTKLESILKNELSYDKSAEKGIEFEVVNGKAFNPNNEDKYLLMKRTSYENRFVVYDSGFFEEDKVNILLNRYVLKEEISKKVSNILFETFSLMKHWLPETVYLSKNESRFRIIKDFFTVNTNSKTKNSKIFVADIVELKQNEK